MPKRRRLLLSTPKKTKYNAERQAAAKELAQQKEQTALQEHETLEEQANNPNEPQNVSDSEMSSARGRLKGALLDVVLPGDEDSEGSDNEHSKRERSLSEESEPGGIERKKGSNRQSYVLKLFDRSVDLSQFSEDSPLYPICRAWMVNQPKANYRDYRKERTIDEGHKKLRLPGPQGAPISRIPSLLPEQIASSKDSIQLDYKQLQSLPSRSELLKGHLSRWSEVRKVWLQKSAQVESRYDSTQLALNRLSGNL